MNLVIRGIEANFGAQNPASYTEGQLDEAATIRKFRIAQREGSRGDTVSHDR